MKNQEIIIKLINEIDKIVEDEYYMDELLSIEGSTILDNFSDMLNQIINNNLNNEILNMINKLKYKDIFLIHNGEKYIKNNYRIEIEEYILNNKELYLDYELIKNNIKDNYKLVNYLKDKSKIVELIDLNEFVLLLIEGKYATKELIEKQIQKSDFVSKIFLGLYGKDNDIYKYSIFYKDILNIDNIIFNQLKDTLKEDVTKYINASEIVKQNKQIQELVISIDDRMKGYINNN